MTITITANFTVGASEVFQDPDTVFVIGDTATPITLLNLGTIRTTGSLAILGRFGGPDAIVENRGLIEASGGGPTGEASGVGVSAGTVFLNAGELRVTATRSAYGIETQYGRSHSNAGIITVTGPGDSVFDGAIAYSLLNSGSVTNTGTITAITTGLGRAIAITIGRFEDNFIVNDHIIRAQTSTGQFTDNTIGLLLTGLAQPVSSPNIVNTGELSAGVAIRVYNSMFPPQDTVEWVRNTGVINGKVELALGPDRIDNTGAINGDVDLGDGADVVDTTNGTIVGAVALGAGDDTFLGGAGGETVSGGAGNDNLAGRGGIDALDGGDGADFLDGGAGADMLIGGTGDDVLDDRVGRNSYDGGGGVDYALMSLATAAGALTYSVGDAAVKETGINTVTTTSIERISIVGGLGNDTFVGGALADTLDGGLGADSLAGGAGDDIYGVDSAGDTVTEAAGQGSDTVRTTLASFNLGVTANSAHVENLTYTGTGNFTGVGGANAGTLTGAGGADTLIGSTAGGSLDGAAGNDVLWFYGTTTLQGGTGVDHAIQLDSTAQTRSLGASGVEVYVGGGGSDVLDTIGAAATTIVYAGAGNDIVTQGAAGGFIFGQDGADTLNGGSGIDTLIGNAGADSLNGGGGNDVLYIDAADGLNFDGGAGIDYAIVEGVAAVNATLAGRGIEVFVANNGADTIDASGVSVGMGLYGFGGDDVITGPSSSSQLFGQNGNDTLNAGALNDVVLGGNGNDQLFGAAGDDLLIGEAGDDLLVGGLGADILYGDINGTGSDTFRFAAGDVQAGVRDQIVDFGDVAGNQDIIQFSGIAQNQVTIANDGGGNVLLTIAATGGTYSILVIGTSAAAIQDDLLFGP